MATCKVALHKQNRDCAGIAQAESSFHAAIAVGSIETTIAMNGIMFRDVSGHTIGHGSEEGCRIHPAVHVGAADLPGLADTAGSRRTRLIAWDATNPFLTMFNAHPGRCSTDGCL